jgi:hypothetical protein
VSIRTFLTRWRQRRAERAAAREEFQVVIYFHGPATSWADKVAEREIIARYSASRLWLARSRARSIHDSLNERRCGYVILHGEKVIERIEPEPEDVPQAEPQP